jgi:hypothetical protein
MWDDVIIGTSKLDHKLCSATKIFNISVENISENKESYWITDCILGTGISVYKDTPEAKKIANLIEKNVNKSVFQNYLDKLILKHISPSKLKIKINNVINASIEKGKKLKQNEFLSVLGIREKIH